MLATQAPCQGILVGALPELIEQAKSAYLIAPQANDWKTRFHSALAKLSDAFWSNSFEVSPEETAAEVEPIPRRDGARGRAHRHDAQYLSAPLL